MARHAFRWTWTCVLLAVALMLGLSACQTGESGAASEPGRAAAATAEADAGNPAEAASDDGEDAAAAADAAPRDNDAPDDIALPPVQGAERFQPLRGDRLERARKPLDAILTDLETPGYLHPAAPPRPNAAPDEAATAAPPNGAAPGRDEPPLAAQRAYVAGRLAWHEGNTYQAISELESALRLAPNRPEILRLLGHIYTEAGNKVRGAVNFRNAVRADPAHVESVFQLGRFALEQGDYDEAIVVLHHALEQVRRRPDADAALAPLLHYYLAGALREQGYAAAAIEQHARHRAARRGGRSLSRTGRELAIITEQARFTWAAIGDMHQQLNQPAEALAAYRRALAEHESHREADRDAADAGAPPADLIARLLYTHLRLGDLEAARRLAIEQVRRTEADDASLLLVHYLTQHAPAADQSAPDAEARAMAAQLRRVYVERGRPGGLAIAVANLMPADQGQTLLREHLEARPDDHRVFRGLLERLLPRGAARSEPEHLAEAITVTAAAMADAPAQLEQRAEAMFAAAGSPAALLDGFEALDASQRGRAMVQLLHGLVLMRAGLTDRALAPLEQAMQAAPQVEATRLALAQLAIRAGDHERARELLEPLADRDDPRIVRLRVQVLAATGDLDGALALLNQRIDQGRPSVELILQKAQLQIRAGEAPSAERTLLDALNMYPTDERLYAMLRKMYEPDRGAPLIEDHGRQWSRLARRLLDTIPESRLGRMIRAELHEANGQMDEAVRLYSGLLDENPTDLEVIRDLVQLYRRHDQRQDAITLLDEKVAAHPTHVGLLDLAAWLYLLLDRPEQAVRTAERAFTTDQLDDPGVFVRILRIAMRRAGQGNRGVDRLAALSEQFEPHEAEIRLEMSMLLERLGEVERAEQVIVETLEAHPDHAPTQNALGYAWAQQGRNLERAKALIEQALETEPNSAAYLDSLGWVYYKLGRFEEAVTWLERARAAEGGDHAVIVDHLGDALFRVGRLDDARRAWGQAASLHGEELFADESPDMDGLRERAYEKIRAVRGGDDVPVAPVPGAVGERGGEAAQRR